MTFSIEWEQTYQEGKQRCLWPWSDLVSYVFRYSRPDCDPFRVLELGFGVGANIPFFLSLGVEYYGIEGSIAAVEDARSRFDEGRVSLLCGDFTSEIQCDESFDLVVDRASLTQNSTDAIRKCVALVRDKMNPGAKFIGIDWFSMEHSDFSKGVETTDFNTRHCFPDGPFRDVGEVHFSDEAHLRDLFSDFDFTTMEHKVVNDCTSPDACLASYNFICEKR